MELFYNGVDIYPYVSINQCVHTMYGTGHTDELKIRFNDVQLEWDKWNPQRADSILLRHGASATGAMYVHSIMHESSSIVLRAFSMPVTAVNTTNKSWEKVRFIQLCEEIGTRHKLHVVYHGIRDQMYSYVSQSGKPDFQFLHYRCRLEGASFLVYDNTLVVYDERFIENQEPTAALLVTQDSKFSYENKTGIAYGRADITNGMCRGQFVADTSSGRILNLTLDMCVSNQAEINRFAMNLLRSKNKMLCSGEVWQNLISKEIAPGNMIAIETEGAKSWDGNAFVHLVRNDYLKKESKIVFRRKLEGY